MKTVDFYSGIEVEESKFVTLWAKQRVPLGFIAVGELDPLMTGGGIFEEIPCTKGRTET